MVYVRINIKGQQNRVNRTDCLSEGKSVSERVILTRWPGVSKMFMCCVLQRFLEVFREHTQVSSGIFRAFSPKFFRGFQRFFSGFHGVLSAPPSEADFLSEPLSPVAPNRVAP